MKRFAIYFAPPENAPLMRLASSWLGRDAFADASLPAPPRNGFSHETWLTATSDPRVYGFHATLKPPFRLAAGAGEEELAASVRRFAASQSPFLAPPLQVASISRFVALTLSQPCRPFSDLAAECVRAFDGFRAPPLEAELARRRQARLSPTQLAHLERWGYPYVMEEWRFHMTLTSSLEPEVFRVVQAHLQDLFVPHCQEAVEVNSICLFEQPGEGEPFRVRERFHFR